jgi:hypothetical protein
MLHGAAGTPCKCLIMLGTALQHMRHENGPKRSRSISALSLYLKVVGEVGLEPTKA